MTGTLTVGGNTAATLQAVYPVGSIYINASVSTNPATLLGFGTWTAFGAGRVMVGLDSGDTDFDAAEETGGAKTKTLSISELPAHTHTIAASTSDTDAGGISQGNTTSTTNVNTGSTGSTSAFSLLQPYIVVYMWKRTV